MGCTLLTRLLHFRQRPSAPSSSFSFLGSRSDPSPRSQSLPNASTTSTDPDLELWGMMAGQGTSSLAVRNLPRNLSLDQLSREFRSLEGFIQARIVESAGPTIVAFVDFATNADAAKAMAANQIVMFDGQLYTTVSADEDPGFPSPRDQEIFHPRKKLKTSSTAKTRPQCQICTIVIEGPHSKPCRSCKGTWCFDCVKTMFIGATHDHERMPAKCCGRVFHYGVAGGILDIAEYEIYKAKYDEFCTSNPLYCPIATCSTFIPPRLMHPVDNKITCHLCATSVCIQCRQVASDGHQCAPTDSNIAKIKELNYKLCPKCGTGVMKMYGCPHIRCAACGAHWCYDCSRPINTCYKRPCRAAREDGQYDETDDGTESEAEDETTESPHVISSTPQWPADLLAAQAAETARLAAEPEVVRASPPEPSVEAAPARDGTDVNSSGDETVAMQPGNAEVEANGAGELLKEVLPFIPAETVNPTEEHATRNDTHSVLNEQNLQANTFQIDQFTTVAPSVEPSENAGLPPREVLLDRYLRSASPSPQDGAATPRPQTPPSPATLRPAADDENASVNNEDEEINLDDPEGNDWEVDEADFGEEPDEESWDVWGCNHTLVELRKDAVDECWMRDTATYLDCMRCFEKITFWEKEGRGKGKKKADPASAESERKKREAKMAYDCRYCGVVYCGTCREEVKRLAKRERRLERRDVL